ncbi:unnamed protein product [Heterobilharzia americana]|nr:unnamed protein product [Heterobilharzia americana]
MGHHEAKVSNPPKCLSNVLQDLPGIVMKCHVIQPVYMITYFYTRIVLIHILPCGILIVLTIILVIKMHSIMKLRTRLGLNKKRRISKADDPGCISICCVQKKRRLSERSRDHVKSSLTVNSINNIEVIAKPSQKASFVNPQAISRMLIVVLIKFIAMHLPNAIVLTIYVLKSMWKVEHVVKNNTDTTITAEVATIGILPEIDSGTFSPTLTYNYTLNTSSTSEYYIKDAFQHEQKLNSRAENHDNFDNYLGKVVILCNLVILVSYQLNFFIYYTMSTQFKETFNSLCFSKLFKFHKH